MLNNSNFNLTSMQNIHSVLHARPTVFQLCVFYVFYVLAAGFGQGLALIPGIAISFWPPAGIFVATLLLSSKYSWPWWILAGCTAEITCNAIWFHNSIPSALIYFSANALLALTAAGLIRFFVDMPFRLETLEEVAAFVVLGAGVAPMVSATVIAATDVFLGKYPFWTSWAHVWLGDSTGLLVSGPLTIVTLNAWHQRAKISWPSALEAVAVIVILLTVSILAFKAYLPSPYLTLPPLLWISARFQLKGASVALALIAITEAFFVVINEGELAGQSGLLMQKIVGLQTFLGVAAVSSLVVAVLSLQYKRALHLVEETNAGLETRVLERTKDLQETNTQLNLALTAASMTAWRFNPQSGLVELSQNAASVLELNPEDTIQDASQGFALIHPDDVEQHRAKVDQALASNGRYLSHYRHIHDGRVVWFEEHAQAIVDPDTRNTELIGITANITEEKVVEEALRASERELAAIFAASDVGMAQSDPVSRRLLRVNAAMSAITGYSTDELLSMTVDDLNHPDDNAQHQSAWRKLDSEFGYSVERRYGRKDGSTVWVQMAGNLIEDVEQKPLRTATIAFDVTARKLATEALETSERFSRSVLEASPDCVKVMASTGELEFMNTLGKIQLEIDDFNLWVGSQWSSHWPEETRQTVVTALDAARSGKETRFEAFCPTDKGTAKWWDVVVTPVLDARGQCIRIVSVSRDITERKQNEHHQALLMNELNHRVKNTLATIQSMASQTLRTSPSLAEAKTRFDARLMSLSKAHDVLTQEKWDSAPLADIVKRAVMPYDGLKHDNFVMSGPDVRLSAQMALAFAMVLHELCTNAVKYGALSNDKGKVTISWNVLEREKLKRVLKFRWAEKGGPPVIAPATRGFGTKLIERSLASDLGGNVKITFAKKGVNCVISASLTHRDKFQTIPRSTPYTKLGTRWEHS